MAQGAASTAAAEGAAETVVYKGLLDGFRRTVAAEGPLAVYKGLGVVLLGAAPAQALYFGGMKGTQTVLGDSGSANFAAGLVAQLTGKFLPLLLSTYYYLLCVCVCVCVIFF